MYDSKERRRKVAQERSAGNPGNRKKHKSPSKIRRLERRAALRRSGFDSKSLDYLDALTHARLKEIATSRKIAGRSKMTKPELALAIRVDMTAEATKGGN